MTSYLKSYLFLTEEWVEDVVVGSKPTFYFPWANSIDTFSSYNNGMKGKVVSLKLKPTRCMWNSPTTNFYFLFFYK